MDVVKRVSYSSLECFVGAGERSGAGDVSRDLALSLFCAGQRTSSQPPSPTRVL